MAHNYTNTASKAILDSSINSSVGSLSVSSYSGYPSAPFYILVDRDTSAAELMEVTAVAGSTLTVTRGAGGTAATSHSSGAFVEHVIPAAVPQSVEQHVEATSNIHGVTGALIGADSAGTLANKTFRGAHLHTFSDSLPDSPAAGFQVNADNSVARDGFVVANTGANADRNAYVLRQSGSDRFQVFNDGTVKITPSGAASRPSLESSGNIKAENFESTDDITAAGDIVAQGTVEGSAVNAGNVNVSGTLSSTGNNTLGTVTTAGKITANAAGTGLTVTNAAEVGSLSVTSGNAVLSGSGAKLQFPASVSSPSTAGTTGQVRYLNGSLEVWNGTFWSSQGGATGTTVQTTNSYHQTGASSTVASAPISNPYSSNAPYYVLLQGQCEINSVPDGTRFDLQALLDSTSGTVLAVGLGNGFVQTGIAFAGPYTGTHTIFFCTKRAFGSGSCDVSAFNQFFTFAVLPAG